MMFLPLVDDWSARPQRGATGKRKLDLLKKPIGPLPFEAKLGTFRYGGQLDIT
jgi:uncharacterized protein (DUF2384 family)